MAEPIRPPDPPPADAGAGYPIADVVQQLRGAMRRAARAADPASTLSVAQLELLACVADHPGARPSQVARLLRLAPNSVTTMANSLRTRGLVTRTSGADDRRTVVLGLTEAGMDAVRRRQTVNAEILRRALAALHPGWQHLVTAALPALAELVGAIDELAAEQAADH